MACEILKALRLRRRGPELIACPTCGRLQFDMDTVVAEVEKRLEDYEDPIVVSVLGCAVNGIGEARHADFGITGAKDAGAIYAKGEMVRKFDTGNLVDELFIEIDKYYAAGKKVVVDEARAAEARQWLAQNEDETAMTPGGDLACPRRPRLPSARTAPTARGLTTPSSSTRPSRRSPVAASPAPEISAWRGGRRGPRTRHPTRVTRAHDSRPKLGSTIHRGSPRFG